jgi:glycine hydroxymethyltransferase
MIVAGASSYPRLIDYSQLSDIAAQNSAYLMVDMAHIAGLVAAGVIPSPVRHADFVTFTTYKTLRGGRGGVILCKQPYAERIDRSVFPGCQGTPCMSSIAAKAVCFEKAATPDFKALQHQTVVNARFMAAVLAARGYRIVSGGTDTHMVLVDLRPKGLTGGWAEKQLEKAGLIVNRNPIPGHQTPAGIEDGLRLGTPAISSRGMREPEAQRIAEWVDTVLTNPGQEQLLRATRQEVTKLCRRFPILC